MKPTKVLEENMEGFFKYHLWGRDTKLRSHERLIKFKNIKKIYMAKKTSKAKSEDKLGKYLQLTT